VNVSQYVLSRKAIRGGVGVNVYFDAGSGDGAELGLHSAGFDRRSLDQKLLEESVGYVVEAIERMMRVSPPLSNNTDVKGIVVAIGERAVRAVIPRGNPAVSAYLSDPNVGPFERRSRFVVASFVDRVVVAANAVQGASAGIVEMLEFVGYEVLGMGPSWTDVPDRRRSGLRFNLDRYGEPSLLFRLFGATSSGSAPGVATLTDLIFDPVAPDETVTASYRRWLVGTRTAGSSLPPFQGHALPKFGPRITERIRASVLAGVPVLEGFLGEVQAGLPQNLPDPRTNRQVVYVSTDSDPASLAAPPVVFTPIYVTEPAPAHWAWETSGANGVAAEIDVSVSWVRDLIFQDFQAEAAVHFNDPYNEAEPFVYGIDPDDGLGLLRLNNAHDPNWYVGEMLALNAPPFGPYHLHNHFGIDQQQEKWEQQNPSDTAFGLANWLLWKYDAHIGNQLTSGGLAKRDLVRCELQCYGTHDVPPTFNIDSRLQISVHEAYTQNRGLGRWRELRTPTDSARAFKVMAPKIVLSHYTIPSQAGAGEPLTALIPPRFSSTDLDDLLRWYGPATLSNFKGSQSESDFNFGQYGPFYYLGAKLLWNQNLAKVDLEQLRDHWIERAFGQGALAAMRAYFTRRSPQEMTHPGPREWGTCARFIDEAIKQTPAGTQELERLWDFAQYWYAYALVDVLTNGLTQTQKDDALNQLRKFMWKGQMAYTVAMYPIAKRFFADDNVAVITAGIAQRSDAAHYTPEERKVWWRWTLLHWSAPTVHDFTSGRLSNGSPIRSEDLNDLVSSQRFAGHPVTPYNRGFVYNGNSDRPFRRPLRFVCAGQRGQTIGAKIYWRSNSSIAPTYKVERWVRKQSPWKQQRWDVPIHRASGTQLNPIPTPAGEERYECLVTYPVAVDGTYRFTIYSDTSNVWVTQMSYDVENDTVGAIQPLCFTDVTQSETQATSSMYMYIPKGTHSLDFDYWADDTNWWRFRIYRSFPPSPATLALDWTISATNTPAISSNPRGTHSIPLPIGTDGTVMQLEANGFAIPLFHSIPMLWAMTPDQLLVPAKVAKADRL
jgi:hypothetical protein